VSLRSDRRKQSKEVGTAAAVEAAEIEGFDP